MKRLRHLTIFIFCIILFIVLYDCLVSSKIKAKPDSSKISDYLRIGYINLHSNKISKEELKKIEAYDCDLWLFLEWNGNNFNNYKKFSSRYKIQEIPNSNTTGLCVLSKFKEIKVIEINNGNQYLCRYPRHLIQIEEFESLNLFFLHVPPPVSTCGMQTNKFISDFILDLSQLENSASNIIIGDFNMLPFENGIKKLKQMGYKDSYKTLNNLPLGTYGFIPLFPKIFKLDYVFHKGDILPQYVSRFSLNTSDHSGWVADFIINNK